VADWEPVIHFAYQPKLVGVLAEYMGQIPVISNVSVSYTLPGDAKIGSQLFHTDMNDPLHFHLVMPVEAIHEESGPVIFLPGDISRHVVKETKYKTGRLTDETVYALVVPS